MESFDSAGLPSGGSRLLSQSPQFSFASASSSSHTGPGGDDLSLSELYPDDHCPPERERDRQTRHNPKTRPSIAEALGFGARAPDRSENQSTLGTLEDVGEELEEEDGGAEADVTVRGNGEEAEGTRNAAQLREERLQNDLFVLRQLNGAFAVYNDALREAQAGTEVNCPCTSPNLSLSNIPDLFSSGSASPNSSSRRTRCLTNTSTFYPRQTRSRDSSSTSDGWAPRRYVFVSSSLSVPCSAVSWFFETWFL